MRLEGSRKRSGDIGKPTGLADLVILPIQDAFGWRDWVNTPATVTGDNWSWRMPWPVDEWLSRQESVAVADHLRGLASHHGRLRLRHEHARAEHAHTRH